jgi:CBS domain-containing protein/gamma-glutamyl:cysteine ligase YbdK (ATP-grasp superfamily)
VGDHNLSARLEGESHRNFVSRLLQDLRALEKMVQEDRFETGVRRIGAEQEMFLVDASRRPACKAMEVLAELNDPQFTTELGLFNLEVNLDPLVFEGQVLSQLEADLVGLVAKANQAAHLHDASVILAGILPTLRKSDLGLDSMTPLPRYEQLNDVLNAQRGGPYDFHVEGLDELSVKHDNVMVEACNTSFQVHFQVAPEEFPELYNVAQLVAGPLMAAATNAPLFLGRRLWRETRIALFEQSIDTRGASHHLRERQPRVSFGSKWVRESVTEIFKEDIVRYRVILGSDPDEDPIEVLQEGGIPRLKALCMHNGTVYRWNRVCYGSNGAVPHLRIENRILPAGPTTADEVANAAFWFGMISAYSQDPKPVADRMDFARVKGNFARAARYGLDAVMDWFDDRSRVARDLILEELLPRAREGLESKAIDQGDIERYLDIVRRRVEGRKTGADWMLCSLEKMGKAASLSERLGALTQGMVSRQASGKPVADWTWASLEEAGGWQNHYLRVEQYMTTDLFTVHEDESIDLVARMMDWQKIRHVLVEDGANRLVGLVSYRSVLKFLYQRPKDGRPEAVARVMKSDVCTITPETRTLDAIRLMKRERVGCLPVVKNDRLVGVVTERDFMFLARDLMERVLERGEGSLQAEGSSDFDPASSMESSPRAPAMATSPGGEG